MIENWKGQASKKHKNNFSLSAIKLLNETNNKQDKLKSIVVQVETPKRKVPEVVRNKIFNGINDNEFLPML